MCGGFWFYVALIKNAFVCCVHKNKEKQIKCRGQRGVSACLIVYVWAKWNRLGEDRVSVLCEDVKHSAQWWKSTVKFPVKGWRDFFCWQVRQSQRINRVLTLHAQPIGAVLRLEHHALTVLSPVFGCWVAAFSPPPVGALCPTGGPLTPLCPQAIHYHITDRTDEGRANEMTNEKVKMNLAREQVEWVRWTHELGGICANVQSRIKLNAFRLCAPELNTPTYTWACYHFNTWAERITR